MSTDEAEVADARRQWFIVNRWQEYDGEWRANLLRVLAVGAFYGIQLAHFHWWAVDPQAEQPFHRAATALAVAWMALALAVLVALRRGFLPLPLKYITTAVDIVLLTALACLGSGPNSPLVLGYFLIIALAALRFSLPLVRCATIGVMVAYLVTVGWQDDVWFDGQHVVAPVAQIVMLVSLGLVGIISGQMVRRAADLAAEYLRRVRAVEGRDA